MSSAARQWLEELDQKKKVSGWNGGKLGVTV